ncbi:peptidase C39 family protein [Salinibacterium sp. G-O1]|uniref:peptidase C39 family protein n=1 Tax=Salinibacterium sp. G-O1 TaxID=3046208 RepID=UPI0024B993B6|nr:peptidase C39 family protein [Salinibacterium sp. G-O1]MDJ0333932.1 peptidase C39 family protein [Salinibacterium sp. G-O1]
MEPSTHTVERITPAQLPAALLSVLGDERAAHWQLDRGPYNPQVWMLDSPDGTAAALTSSRPNTRYTKLVDLSADGDAAARALLGEVIAASVERGDAALKWQLALDAELPDYAHGLGFTALRDPISSADGTRGFRGFVLWHTAWPHPQLTYYGQTTMFTCGAVAAMTALTHLGLDPFASTADEDARERELAFWRTATNFPACEPLGLAVAVHDAAADSAAPIRLELHLDTTEPTLLESYSGEDRVFREQLQAQSRAEAASRGIQQHTEVLSIEQIVERIAGGELAILLIEEAPMHGASTPHWVVAHAVQGDTVLLNDPWITAEQGETWVDSHDLPVSIAVLDQMVAFGDPAYRGVIFVTRS